MTAVDERAPSSTMACSKLLNYLKMVLMDNQLIISIIIPASPDPGPAGWLAR